MDTPDKCTTQAPTTASQIQDLHREFMMNATPRPESPNKRYIHRENEYKKLPMLEITRVLMAATRPSLRDAVYLFGRTLMRGVKTQDEISIALREYLSRGLCLSGLARIVDDFKHT